MPIEITMPALSPTMTEGNLVKWVKKEGDKIKSGDIIAEIETDKATMELEASNNGILGKIIIPEGSEAVKVNTLIALVLKEGEDKAILEGYKPKEETPKKQAEATKPPVGIATASTTASSNASTASSNASTASSHTTEVVKTFASPLAKRIAEEKGINVALVQGTGPNGRVIKEDVLTFKTSASPVTNVFAGARKGDIMEPISNVRKIIAKRLLESKQNIPHFYLTLDVTMDEALIFRAKANKGLETKGIKISVNDIIIKASALALADFPKVNASFTEGGMLMYGNVDVSVAVSTDSGLITPIIKNADAKSISAISIEMKELAKKARENKLKPEEFQGGGFSVSNLGMYGITTFSAIINPPQSAILAVGGTVKKPIFDEKTNGFKPADILSITISADHRVVDGALGAEFLNRIKFYLENPIMLGV
jgi:pyruvate dehydrogenase E2 component (dihydrolipoamide acetyltransferase)